MLNRIIQWSLNNRRLVVASAALLLVYGSHLPVPSWVVAAQSGRAKEPGEAIKLDTDLAEVKVTVADQTGRFVKNLKKDDFAVFEDGVKQDITFFNTDEKIPVSIGIVFDTSGSMVDKIDGVQDAMKHFIETTNPDDDIFLIRFSTDVRLVQDFTADRQLLMKTIDRLDAEGSTSLYDAILQTLREIRRGKHQKRALLVVTDGNDTSSRSSLTEARAVAKKAEVLIYCVGIGHGERGSFTHGRELFADTVDIGVLRSISDATGGRSYLLEGETHFSAVDKADQAIQEIAAELRMQYTLAYSPTNRKRDGSYREIQVRVVNKEYAVRAKQGYWAPGDKTGQDNEVKTGWMNHRERYFMNPV